MTRLSVNVNKIAVLRNARQENQPCLLSVVKDLINFGVRGITVHPRPDGRHILYQDVREIRAFLKKKKTTVEFNVEGFPSPKFLDLIEETKPHQCTLVPDAPNVITSDKGWDFKKEFSLLEKTLKFLKKLKVRSSVFLDPLSFTHKQAEALKALKPDRAELYTKSYALSFNDTKKRQKVISIYKNTAKKIYKMGIKLNAGHDLNIKNLTFFLKNIACIEEVSIGHAFICEALYKGLNTVSREYLKACQT